MYVNSQTGQKVSASPSLGYLAYKERVERGYVQGAKSLHVRLYHVISSRTEWRITFHICGETATGAGMLAPSMVRTREPIPSTRVQATAASQKVCFHICLLSPRTECVMHRSKLHLVNKVPTMLELTANIGELV